MICGYGCGREAKFPPRKGMTKWCCSEHFTQCPAKRTTGSTAWNRGLTKKIDQRVLLYSEKRKGQKPWNKGLTKNTDDRVLQASRNIEKREKLAAGCKIKTKIHRIILKRESKIRKELFIEKLIKTKKGSKYKRIAYLSKKYPLAFQKLNIYQNKKNILLAECKVCGRYFEPKYDQLYYALYRTQHNFRCFLYCSTKCKLHDPKYLKRNTDIEYKQFTEYVRLVERFTRRSIRKHKDKILNLQLRGVEYHLDHRLSIFDGFHQNISPDIIGGWKNLEIIPALNNLKKNRNSNVTLSEIK